MHGGAEAGPGLSRGHVSAEAPPRERLDDLRARREGTLHYRPVRPRWQSARRRHEHGHPGGGRGQQRRRRLTRSRFERFGT
eukprot:2350444-Pyramimonas_sp.AAC.1